MDRNPCPACGRFLRIHWLHGHAQCATCGATVVPCCDGAGEEVEKLEGPSCGVLDLDDLERVFAAQGTPSLTRTSLLYELCLHGAASFDEAQMLLDHAQGLGRLRWDRAADVCTLLPRPDGPD